MSRWSEVEPVVVELSGDPRAAAAARSACRETLGRWSLPAALDPVLLVSSELVGNAVRHGRPPVRLLLRRLGGLVLIDVHDELPDVVPALGGAAAAVDLDAEGGRGLLLVDPVSAECGVEQVPGDGKLVRSVVADASGRD